MTLGQGAQALGRPSPTTASDTRTAPPRMRRIALASFIGTMVEFYDFNIYGVAAALVFPSLFFPALGPAAGTVASFAVLAVAFVARPFGSILFGHFGDRFGRKKTLVATMLMMGLATVLVGVMPTASQIGVAAPILIVVLRVLQGLAAGGEWAGGVLFASENAPKARRGIWSMLPSLGGGVATILANTTFLITAVTMSTDTFVAWGWRVPFIASIVLVIIGLWVRLQIDETRAFKKELKRAGPARAPFLEALRHQPRQLLLATGTAVVIFPFSYIGATYLTSYGSGTLALPRVAVLAVGILGGLALCLGILITAALSDRVGRRKIITISTVIAIVWSLLLFPVIDNKTVATFGIGVFLTMFISGLINGPAGAFLSEVFQTRYRYTATGLCYSLGSVLGGAIPPIVAAAIIPSFGALIFSLFLCALFLIGLVCVSLIGETSGYDMERSELPDPSPASSST